MTELKQDIQARICFGSNDLFRKGYRDGFRYHCRNTPEMVLALEALLPDPDAAFATGRIIKNGTRTHGGEVVLNGKSYYLKRYNDRGIWYRLRHLLKSSRAIRTWHIGWSFYDHRAPTPMPLVCLEERSSFLLRRSYILMELVEPAEILNQSWPSLTTQEKSSVLKTIAEALSKMHKAGYVHGDLKWSNILVSRSGEKINVALVDLDSCSKASWFRKSLARKDIKQFLRWLKRYETNQVLHQKFQVLWTEHYLKTIKF